MWLVEFLWQLLPVTGLSFLSLWELGSHRCEQGRSWPWRCPLPCFSSTLWTVCSYPLPPLTPCFSSTSLSGLLLLIESENRRNRLLREVPELFCLEWLSQMSFFCVRRGWLSLSLRRVGERKVLGDLSNPWEWAEVSQPSWIPSHAHPWKTILPLSPMWVHMYPGDCCFAVFVSKNFH